MEFPIFPQISDQHVANSVRLELCICNSGVVYHHNGNIKAWEGDFDIVSSGPVEADVAEEKGNDNNVTENVLLIRYSFNYGNNL